jgi:divalent metal cation (Fe/Co/Zn/Cd) transporter
VRGGRLVYQTKHLLIGEGAAPKVVEHMRELATSHPGVLDVRYPATVHLSPDEVLAILDVRFHPQLGADSVATAIDDIEGAIKSRYPEMRYILIEAQRVVGPVEGEELA